MFLRFSGTLVFVLALLNLNSGLALSGINISFPANESQQSAPLPAMNGDVQEVSLAVTPYGTYEPDVLTIKAGMPVRWKIEGTNAFGCTSIMTIPSLNISQALHAGENVIEFTAPQQRGALAFMCSMGMVRGSFNVI
jgi:plastocyanin domain-containing protein